MAAAHDPVRPAVGHPVRPLTLWTTAAAKHRRTLPGHGDTSPHGTGAIPKALQKASDGAPWKRGPADKASAWQRVTLTPAWPQTRGIITKGPRVTLPSLQARGTQPPARQQQQQQQTTESVQ